MKQSNRLNMIFKIGLYSFAVLMLFKACNREKREVRAIPWMVQLDSALVVARESGKPMMIDFMATWCPPCRAMEDSTFHRKDVVGKAEAFVPVRIDVDQQPDVANAYGGNAQKYGGIGIPNMLFLTSEGERICQIVGYHSPEALIAVMDSVINIIPKTAN